MKNSFLTHSFLYFFLFKLISIQKVLDLYFLKIGKPDPSFVCLLSPGSELKGMDSKELFAEPSIFPLAWAFEHLYVTLFRGASITETFSNCCWPLELLPPRNEHPCLSILSFLSLERHVIPTGLFMKPELAEFVWFDVCDIREVKTTMRRTALSSFAFPRQLGHKSPAPRQSLHCVVSLFLFLSSKLTSRLWKKGQFFSPVSSVQYSQPGC